MADEIFYLLACLDCGEVLDDDALVMPFGSADDRWFVRDERREVDNDADR